MAPPDAAADLRKRFSSSYVRATAVQALSNGLASSDRAGADKLPRCAQEQPARLPAETNARARAPRPLLPRPRC